MAVLARVGQVRSGDVGMGRIISRRIQTVLHIASFNFVNQFEGLFAIARYILLLHSPRGLPLVKVWWT